MAAHRSRWHGNSKDLGSQYAAVLTRKQEEQEP